MGSVRWGGERGAGYSQRIVLVTAKILAFNRVLVEDSRSKRKEASYVTMTVDGMTLGLPTAASGQWEFSV